MREILFKAKRIDNGEWVQGYYLKYINTLTGDIEHRIFVSDGDGVIWYVVDENTICQFTGRTDKKGNAIWENDIVDTLYDIEYVGVSAQRIGKSIIVFHDSCFMKKKNGCDSGYYYFIASDKETVIGNIFDNPELMKGDT